MIVLKTKTTLKHTLTLLRQQNKTIGFVPTMGALHDGHLSLTKAAFEENTAVVVSIFVNPTQFDKQQDLANYPKTLAQDTKKLKDLSEEVIVYAPNAEEVYGADVAAEHFNFDGLEHQMEGRFRTGHFNGVGTILKHFFELIAPDRAYFGEKDFQQLLIVKNLVAQLSLSIKIIGCPIYRTSSGLAMSSRNKNLSASQKKEAAFIFHILTSAKERFNKESVNDLKKWVTKQFETNAFLRLEYFEISDIKTLKPVQRKSAKKQYRAFIAVFADNIRLIDNIALNY
jgi:pantoate--beta-alanine ligase